MFLDKPVAPDVNAVLNAAALLDITEYELFQLAFQRWHGKPADDAAVGSFFIAYMFNDIVPVWVRHFARLVERLDQAGALDRRALGVPVQRFSEKMASRGLRFGVMIVTVLATLFILAQLAAQSLGLGDRCMFPPCY